MKFGALLMVFIACLLISCNVDEDKLHYIMMPKILEKEITDSIPSDFSNRIEQYFPPPTDSLYSLYSCNNGASWGVLNNGKPITGSLYIEIIAIDDYFCITKRLSAGIANLKNYGKYEEFDDWTTVINKQGNVIIPFSIDYDSNNIGIADIDGEMFIKVSSALNTVYYNGKTGVKYSPLTGDASP